MLERREPCFTNIHFLPDYPFVAFKGSGFLLLTLQLLVILPVNCSLVTLSINSVVQQCCVGGREDESHGSLCVVRLRCSCPGKGLTLGRVSWLILQLSHHHHGGQSVHFDMTQAFAESRKENFLSELTGNLLPACSLGEINFQLLFYVLNEILFYVFPF